MNSTFPRTTTAFNGPRHLASGSLVEVAFAIKTAVAEGAAGPLLAFDDATGRVVDINVHGTRKEIKDRLEKREAAAKAALTAGEEIAAVAEPATTDGTRGRGRPRLGVVAREVTLLPRHWDWLSTQPGGASVALRKLVEEARRTGSEKDRRRKAHEAAYCFMSATAGDLPGFEEATRALFADDRPGFDERIAAWPPDLRDYAVMLAFGQPGV